MQATFFFSIRAILAVPIAGGLALAAVYHISPTGDDAANGTAARPWKSVSRANSQKLRPGDRLLFQGGANFLGSLVLRAEDAGTPTKPVIIGSYGNGKAHIEAGAGSAVLVENAGGIEIENLVVSGAGRLNNTASGIKVIHNLPEARRLKHIRIRDVEASGFGRAGIFIAGLATDGTQSGFDDVRIERCDAHDNVYYGIIVGGPWDDDRSASVVPGDQDAGRRPGYTNRNVYIGHSRAWNNQGDPDYRRNHSGSGIFLADTDVATIEHSLAWENGALDTGSEGGPCGIWAAGSNRVTIQFCESFRNRTGKNTADGDGFDLDGGMTNSVLQYNYSHDNDGMGYLIYDYARSPHEHRNNLVRYNISENDGRGKPIKPAIMVASDGDLMSGVDLHNNTIFISAHSDGGLPSGIQIRSNVRGVRLWNNLLIATGGTPALDKDSKSRDVVVQGNGYWSNGHPVRILWEGREFDSLATFRAATAQETSDGKPVGIEADPQLTAAGGGIVVRDTSKLSSLLAYRVKSGSPLIGAGMSLVPVEPGEHDFFLRPLSAAKPGIGVSVEPVP